MPKKGYKKMLAKHLRSANGEAFSTSTSAETKEYFKQFLPESLQSEQSTMGVNRKDNRWTRGANKAVKYLRSKYPDLSLLRDGKDPNTYFVGFERLFENTSVGVDPSDPVAVHRRACVITAQCIMIGHFQLRWERALVHAIAGMPPVPDPEVAGGLLPWSEYVKKKLREFEQVDARLSMKMNRFYRTPTASKRVHARDIDPHGLRAEVSPLLKDMLPAELYEKEMQQSFNPCEGSGYAGNLPKMLEYYRPKREFLGDVELVKIAIQYVCDQIHSHSDTVLKPWTHEQASAWLYWKTDGRTEVGGRMHCKQNALGQKRADAIIEESKNITKCTTRMPCEVGNRFVPAKNVYDETGEQYATIVGSIPKDRTTYAVYKAKQIHDLRYMYPLQRVMAGMSWFVALAGHDATFNINRAENQIAMELYNSLRERDAWGASWDFSAHDAHLDVGLQVFYGQGAFKGNGIMEKLFPETPSDEWEWSYECATQSTRYVEHGILFADYGKLHGVDSGEGWTNGGESLVGAVMLIYSLLKTVQRNVSCVHDLVKVDGFVDALVNSTHMVFMGDDTASVTNHAHFVGAINGALEKLGRDVFPLDGIVEPTPEEAAADFRDFGTNPSTDKRKISFFSREDRRRLFDFTAHQTFVEFNESGEVVQHIHGYYCFLRSLASYVFCEARSPQEMIVAAARHKGYKVHLGSIFNPKVISFFVALQYSILSNTYMNPERLMVPIFTKVLRKVPHFGGFFAVAKDPETVERFLKNMPIRETLTEQRLVNSRVFTALLDACARLVEQESVPEIELLVEWSESDTELTLDAYAKEFGFAYADADWDKLYAMYPEDTDPAESKKMKDAHSAAQELDEEVAKLYAPRTYDNVMIQVAKMNDRISRREKEKK